MSLLPALRLLSMALILSLSAAVAQAATEPNGTKPASAEAGEKPASSDSGKEPVPEYKLHGTKAASGETGKKPAGAQSGTKAAGEYEMKTYVVGLLYRGPNWTPEVTEETKKIQEGHMANIRAMAATGKLILAGPFADDGKLRGMFVFDVAKPEEAKALADKDPAIKAGRLVLELHPWYSAKGINVPPPKPVANRENSNATPK